MWREQMVLGVGNGAESVRVNPGLPITCSVNNPGRGSECVGCAPSLCNTGTVRCLLCIVPRIRESPCEALAWSSTPEAWWGSELHLGAAQRMVGEGKVGDGGPSWQDLRVVWAAVPVVCVPGTLVLCAAPEIRNIPLSAAPP